MAKTEKTTATVDVEVRIGSLLPNVISTSDERLQALKDAKELLNGNNGSMAGALFGSNKGGSQYPDPHPLFRVAEYITTGHDYLDTHPKIEDDEVSGDRYEEEGQNND